MPPSRSGSVALVCQVSNAAACYQKSMKPLSSYPVYYVRPTALDSAEVPQPWLIGGKSRVKNAQE